jgi:uncharacterized SAM-binding protein YcdF (DUF218 family)
MKKIIDVFCRIVTLINILLIIICLILISNKALTLKWMANFLITHDELKQSEAIVILGGLELSYRLDEGARLYEEGYGDKIIVSDKYISNTMKNGLVERGVKEEDIILESQAEDTYENADYSRELILQNDFKSIIIVTSKEQSKRAKWVFAKVLAEDDVTMISQVCETDYFFPDTILESKSAKHALVLEYSKIIYYFINGWL